MNGTPLNPFLLLPVWLLLAFYGSAQSQPKPEQFEVSGSQSSGEKEEKRLRQDFFDLPEENAPESGDHQNP